MAYVILSSVQPKESAAVCGSPSDDLFGYIHSMVSNGASSTCLLVLVIKLLLGSVHRKYYLSRQEGRGEEEGGDRKKVQWIGT
jgi:hypothetical protein